ncbi:MAG TPA: 2-phospho-L-lactate guanylyltransferase [Acidimicrobiales bacterium]|nr:2-phospho-L-lactate guanylyltransferase [Acidimicrobiales bacterium]
MPAAVLVPVKSFAAAKRRLADVLSAPERAELARRMAQRVIAAASPLPVHVVCDDEEVAEWAEGAGTQVLWRPGHGLNGAVADGVAALAKIGVTDVLVAHADLPLASALAGVIRPGLITLVPDRHGDGTNVIALPSRLGFRFAYGAGSFRQHLAEARRHRLGVRVWRDRRLGLDVDVPADLDLPEVREVLGWAPTSEGNPA